MTEQNGVGRSSATYDLRRMLDKRGVEWEANDTCRLLVTSWKDASGHGWTFMEHRDGSFSKLTAYHLTPEQAVADTLGTEVTGETSDGYHTFNELYYHRAILFSVIVRDHKERAWKSKLHHDGTMYEGMFIVGIETPKGQATYHYDVDPYWDMFDCKELGRAPEWDGHTSDEAIERIATLGPGTCRYVLKDGRYKCSNCGRSTWAFEGKGDPLDPPNFCPNCGRKVVDA